MAITIGSNALATDFILQSEKNATPANDSGRVAQLEADGKISAFFTKNGQVVNAGETINGATLPVPVYQNKTDNEVYACDGNDLTKLKFIGFATSNGTNGNPITVQFSGVAAGFSALDEGEKYYLSDTAGAISNAPGTYEVLVGVAISTTELFIQKGKRFASGTTSFSATATSTITTGFRPSRVIVHAVNNIGSADAGISSGGWTIFGGNLCIFVGIDGTTVGGASNAWKTPSSTGADHAGVVDTISDTGFRLNNTKTGGPADVSLFWTAEGEL